MLVYRKGILAFQVLKGIGSRLSGLKIKTRSEIHNRDTRNKNKIDIPCYRTALGQRTFHYRAVSLWNALPERLTKITNIVAFKKELMRYLESCKQSIFKTGLLIIFVFLGNNSVPTKQLHLGF